MVEVACQLMSTAGKRQIDGTELAHGNGAGRSNRAMLVLGTEETL